MPIFLDRFREKFPFAEVLLGSIGGSLKLRKCIRFYRFRAGPLAKSQLEPMARSSGSCYSITLARGSPVCLHNCLPDLRVYESMHAELETRAAHLVTDGCCLPWVVQKRQWVLSVS